MFYIYSPFQLKQELNEKINAVVELSEAIELVHLETSNTPQTTNTIIKPRYKDGGHMRPHYSPETIRVLEEEFQRDGSTFGGNEKRLEELSRRYFKYFLFSF